MSSLLCASALALAGLSTAGCQPPVPASPAYDVDVRPIFMSHCVRCHGAGPDGGAINKATQPTGPDGGALASDPTLTSPYYLDVYAFPPGIQKFGALIMAMGSSLSSRIHGPPLPMPPPPAPKLDDWAVKIIDAWIKNPVCSNPPNSDPTICPSDAGQ